MTRSFRKSALLFSLAVLSTTGVIFACADWFAGYDYDSSFTPEAYVDKSYAPLFLSTSEVFYGIGFDDGFPERFNKAIVTDWAAQLLGKIDRKDIEFLLVDNGSSAVVEQLYAAVKQKQALPLRFANLNLTDEKVQRFIVFLHYAKIIEASSTSDPYSWNYGDQNAKPVDPQIMIELESLYGPMNDPFIRNRIWFQIMKGYFYSKNKQGIIPFFERTKAAVPKNVLYYRGLSYIAGVHYHNKSYATSNYLYSVVFSECPPMRTTATYNFHPKADNNLQVELGLTSTDDEKAALWALNGYYIDEIRAIQEIYKLNPKSKFLDFLLSRLINKVEVKANSNLPYDKTAAYYRSQIRTQASDDKMLSTVSQIASEEKTAKPYLWNLAAGYLFTLAGSQPNAEQFLSKVQTDGNYVNLVSKQVRLVRLINTLYNTTAMDSNAETKLLPELDWLYNTVNNSKDEVFRYHHALESSKKYISLLYKEQKNFVLGELFDRNERFYDTPSQLEDMKTFLAKTDKTPWEQLANKLYGVTLDDIYEYQAIIQTYQTNLDPAIAFFARTAKANTKLPGNPFNGKIKDCHDCEHLIKLPVPYTKLSLVQKMKEMQSHINKDEDVYNNSLLLANAYYNLTYFGSERPFYDNTIINQNGNYINPYYQKYFLVSGWARFYYAKALQTATTDEQKAKCTYMLAKCDRNDFYTERYHTKEGFYGDTDIDYQAWPGFQNLKAYKGTKYYQEVIAECGYFKQYVGN